MNEPGPERVTEIFLEASELAPGEREAYLDDACGGDLALRAEVESLLHHDLPSTALAMAIPPTPPAPENIGSYRIVRPLGEGGMGLVYLAEQEVPVRRLVALKVIRTGMDTKQVVARFEAERQALALMDHPCVTKVFDAGATPDGRPYFAMEYVRGVSITDYCDRHRLTIRERLGLFIRVCEGVQHAHQKAIIHRDIKPTNVLVAIQDGKPVPKIIDFGVAKATGQRLTDRTMFTEMGVLVGTLEYMSPEQADLTNLDVDTRADVYGLGMLLYELLVGALPFEPKELRRAGFDAIRRVIREVEPPRPSARLGALGEVTTEAARRRSTDPTKLRRQLAEDLDWIVLKALEKDRGRRYGSPAELAEDIRRHLSDTPVVARPPSLPYQLSRLLRRRRGVVVTTGLVAASLATGLLATTLMFLRAREAERVAKAERHEALRSSYVANLRAAQLSLEAKSVDGAMKRLLACPEELRGWEWRRLLRLASSELGLVRGAHARFSRDGRRLVTVEGASPLSWDVRTLGPLPTARASGRASSDPWSVETASPDGSHILLTMPGPKSDSSRWCVTLARVLDLTTGVETDLGAIEPIARGDYYNAPSWVFSKDGRLLACLGDEGKPSLVSGFDSDRGRRTTRLRLEDTMGAAAASFSPDGNRLWMALDDGRLSDWDLRTSREARPRQARSEGTFAQVTSIDADERSVLLGKLDGEILLWDAFAERVVGSWHGHKDRVSAVTLGRDGTLVSASQDGSVMLWRRERAEPIATWLSAEALDDVSLSPDGTVVAASSASGTRVWSAREIGLSDLGSRIRATGVAAVAVAPDGGTIACALYDSRLAILDRESLDVLARFELQVPVGAGSAHNRADNVLFPGDRLPFYAVRFSPDGSRILSGSRDGALRVHDTRTLSAVQSLSAGESAIMALDVSSDGQSVAIGCENGSVAMLDLAGKENPREIRHGGGSITALTLTQSGTTLSWGGEDGVSVWDLTRLRDAWSARTGARVTSLAYDPEGRWLVAGIHRRRTEGDGSGEGSVRVWDARTGADLATLSTGSHSSDVLSLAYTSDGRILAGSEDGFVHVFGTDPFELLVSLRQVDAVEALAFVPKDEALVCGLRSGEIVVWSTAPTAGIR